MPPPFNKSFSSYQLAAAIDGHLANNKGFAIVLCYSDVEQTFFSNSNADTWEQACVDVAQEMLDGSGVYVGDNLQIRDVFTGRESHHPTPGADLFARVRIGLFGPFFVPREDVHKFEFPPDGFDDAFNCVAGWRSDESGIDVQSTLTTEAKILKAAETHGIKDVDAFREWALAGPEEEAVR